MSIPSLLSHYRKQLFEIEQDDASALMNWIEEVAFWLARVKGETNFKRWLLTMSGALEMKTKAPLALCTGIMEGHVMRAMVAKEIR